MARCRHRDLGDAAVVTAVLCAAGHRGCDRGRGQEEAGMSQLLSHVDGVSGHPGSRAVGHRGAVLAVAQGRSG